MTVELGRCDERIEALQRCDRHVTAEAAFTPGDDYRRVVGLVLAAAEALDPPISASRLEDLRLAVTEACSNAVKVHRPDALDEAVVVTCRIDDERVRVEVADRGPGFDPADLEPLPDPEDPERLRYEHGLGVQLICEIADEVRFRPSPDAPGTVVSIALRR
jgi:serine/threonine-protein kinase RsbW